MVLKKITYDWIKKIKKLLMYSHHHVIVTGCLTASLHLWQLQSPAVMESPLFMTFWAGFWQVNSMEKPAGSHKPSLYDASLNDNE